MFDMSAGQRGQVADSWCRGAAGRAEGEGEGGRRPLGVVLVGRVWVWARSLRLRSRCWRKGGCGYGDGHTHASSVESERAVGIISDGQACTQVIPESANEDEQQGAPRMDSSSRRRSGCRPGKGREEQFGSEASEEELSACLPVCLP